MTERMGVLSSDGRCLQPSPLAVRAMLRPAARRLAAVGIGFAGGWAVLYGALMPFGLGLTLGLAEDCFAPCAAGAALGLLLHGLGALSLRSLCQLCALGAAVAARWLLPQKFVPAALAGCGTLTGMALCFALGSSGADLLLYGMGERSVVEVADALSGGLDIKDITYIAGSCYMTSSLERVYDYELIESYEDVAADRKKYASAFMKQYREQDAIRGKRLVQPHGNAYIVVNPPSMPLSEEELDAVYDLPYTRAPHPSYRGEIPALKEVKFSLASCRGCFGGCNFCSLAFHQGRMITSRSIESCVREVEGFTRDPKFKGYVHDVGGPSANFRHPSCKDQLKRGMCRNKNCLAPYPCKNLDPDHSEYVELLRRLRAIPGVKKVFVRSGIRYDYMLCDDNDAFFRELVRYHISGQLKVAPEHCIDTVLDYMGKPHIGTYERFMDEYRQLNNKYDKEQYVVPYLMSSHPGSTLSDAVALAEYLNRRGRQPEQVQDFYPTPGTISTCMYHTGIDPRTMKPVYVAKTPHEKDMQRALLQWRRPDKRRLVIQALHEAGREDLIGFGKDCLVRPMTDRRKPAKAAEPQPPQRKYGKVYGGGKKPAAARSAQNAKPGKSAKPGRAGKPAASGKSGGKPGRSGAKGGRR